MSSRSTSPRNLVRRPPGLRLLLQLDLSDANAITSAALELIEPFGSIDILVNNAGVLSNDKINDTTLEEWRRVKHKP